VGGRGWGNESAEKGGLPTLRSGNLVNRGGRFEPSYTPGEVMDLGEFRRRKSSVTWGAYGGGPEFSRVCASETDDKLTGRKGYRVIKRSLKKKTEIPR